MERILDTFERRGYSRLVLWLGMRGVPLDRESGIFDGVARAFEDRGRNSDTLDPRFVASLMILVCAAEPLLGTISRRSVKLGAGRPTTKRFRQWFCGVLQDLVEGAA